MVNMRSHRKTFPFLTSAAILGTLVVSPLASPVADAGIADWNAGVKFLDFGGQIDVCAEQPLWPCASGAGIGRSNTLRVHQSDDSGSLRFDGLGSTSGLDDHLWVGAEIGGTCRSGFSAFMAEINIDGGTESSLFSEAEGVGVWAGQRFPVPDGRVMTREKVAVNIPMEHAVGPDRREAIFAVGEAAIADRIAGGMTEAEARSIPFETVIPLDLTGEFVCRGNVGAHVKWIKAATVRLKTHDFPFIALDPLFFVFEMPLRRAGACGFPLGVSRPGRSRLLLNHRGPSVASQIWTKPLFWNP